METVVLSALLPEGSGQWICNRQEPVFRFHFPQAPCIPGSCIIGAMIEELYQQFPQWQVREIIDARFRHFIHPEETLDWHCSSRQTGEKASQCQTVFRLQRGTELCATVSFLLQHQGDSGTAHE